MRETPRSSFILVIYLVSVATNPLPRSYMNDLYSPTSQEHKEKILILSRFHTMYRTKCRNIEPKTLIDT